MKEDFAMEMTPKYIKGQYLYKLWQNNIIAKRSNVDASMKDQIDVYQDVNDSTKYVKYQDPALTDAEITHLFEMERTDCIRSIKNMVTFFTILTVISLIGILLTVLN